MDKLTYEMIRKSGIELLPYYNVFEIARAYTEEILRLNKELQNEREINLKTQIEIREAKIELLGILQQAKQNNMRIQDINQTVLRKTIDGCIE